MQQTARRLFIASRSQRAMVEKQIYVTQPYLPPLEEFTPYLEKIWENKILTNGGPFHQQLEKALCDYLGVKHISLFANGTLALITALQALGIKGEVITTPYSFVATAHALLWQNCTPVFVDIEPNTLNLDPAKIEAAITPQTTAILPVHCYGNPCDTTSIQKIADKYNLRVIYDAAHAFGVEDEGGSILCHGDLSVLSFHATKVFNTFEGGAIVCPDEKTKQHIDHLKNFGFVDETTVVASGINGKMSEINAAFGLLQLKYMPQVIQRRAEIDAYYREHLTAAQGIRCLEKGSAKVLNYSYFPILVDSHLDRDDVFNNLRNQGIFARRYFYPLISSLSMYKGFNNGHTEVANNASRSIICLPIYPELTKKDQDKIILSLTK